MILFHNAREVAKNAKSLTQYRAGNAKRLDDVYAFSTSNEIKYLCHERRYTLTIERRRPLSSLGALLITEPNFLRPIEQLRQDLQERNISVEKRERDNTSVLLITNTDS